MKRLLTLSIVAAAALFAHAQQPPGAGSRLDAGFAEVDRLMTSYAAQAHAPGAAWGVIVDGRLAHTGVTGYRDVSAKAAVDADTVFRIASMTKSFTAMSILKLRDEGKLALDAEAERYVPEMKNLKYPTSDAPKITVRHLLSHSEGFPEDNPWGDRQLADTEEQLSAMLRAGIPFSNAPGLAYEYSNLGFAILGRIVSNVSGERYADYVARNILRPLGMTSTTLEPSEVAPNRRALGYRWEDERWKEEPQLSNGSFGSMGGMLTSLTDLSRYVGVFLSAWPPRDGAETAPVRRASLREMQQLWRFASATLTRSAAGGPQLNAGGYAYGLRVNQSCRFRHIVSHTGGLPGFGSIMLWLPDYGAGIVAFGNVTYTSWTRVTNDAMEALVDRAGLKPRQPTPSPALADARAAVSRLVEHWDDALADRIAAENLFLDRTKERRRAEIERLHASVGACRADARPFDGLENALRGFWTMECEKGKLRVAITLAPTMPPRVQLLEMRELKGTESPDDRCGA